MPAYRSPNLFDELVKELAPGFFVKPMSAAPSGDSVPSAAQIRVDVSEAEDAYTVHAELPGVRKEDIEVSIDGSVISLRTELKAPQLAQGEKTLRHERYTGALARSFQLPQDIDQANAKARYDAGVLTLTLPKKQAGGGQRISIE